MALAACGGGAEAAAPPPSPLPITPSPTPVPPVAPEPQPPAPPAPPQFVTQAPSLDLLHTDLAFDATRRLIYAYVPPADATHPSTIATIEPTTRTVSFSKPMNFVPWHMAVSADGRFLYVASILPRKIVRLALPNLTVDLEVDLGKPTWIAENHPDIDVTMFAGSIAADEQDSERFAVSLVTSTYPVLHGLRIYRGTQPTAELRWSVGSRFGDVVAFDTPDRLVTAKSARIPDTVARLAVRGSDIVELDSLSVGAQQQGGGSARIARAGQAYLTGGGSKIELPDFTFRGQLPPLTLYQQGDPFPLIKGCVFADSAGTVAACLSQWDYDALLPTFRALAFYELNGANPFLVAGLDRSVGPASEILMIEAGAFAVSVDVDAFQNGVQIEPGSYLGQNKRIYFFSGLDTVYRP